MHNSKSFFFILPCFIYFPLPSQVLLSFSFFPFSKSPPLFAIFFPLSISHIPLIHVHVSSLPLHILHSILYSFPNLNLATHLFSFHSLFRHSGIPSFLINAYICYSSFPVSFLISLLFFSSSYITPSLLVDLTPFIFYFFQFPSLSLYIFLPLFLPILKQFFLPHSLSILPFLSLL